MLRIAFILSLIVPCLNAQNVSQRVRSVLAQNQRVHWGVHAVQLKSGRVLASINAEQFFVPASNTKLFTSAYALTALGSDHRFTTRVVAANNIDTTGKLTGDLVLAGGGDPSLSARVYPYNRDTPFGEDRLAPLRDLARQLKDRGVKHIAGRILGDDSQQQFDPVPNGWSAGDGLFEYGAPVSALSFNDNIFELRVDATGITLNPAVEYFALLNEIHNTPGDPRRIRISRQPGSHTVTLSGNLPPGAKQYANELAVEDPALYAAVAFRQVLREEGIRVDGIAAARHLGPSNPEQVELARRDSPPLEQLLQVVDKVSQNLHAELMLRAARQVMPFADFLKLAGIGEKEVNFEDGSGLSRLTLVTPGAMVQLLRFMDKQGQLERFRNFLPVGAEDGTLRNRFNHSPKARAIRAKTGSLSHVSALAGYADSKRYGPIAFHIVANNYNAPAQEVRAAIDRIALALLQ